MKWNFRTIIIIVSVGLAGAILFLCMEYVFKQTGLNSKFYYSLAKAAILTFAILAIYFLTGTTNPLRKTINPKKWNKTIMFRVILSIIVLTLIDQLFNLQDFW